MGSMYGSGTPKNELYEAIDAIAERHGWVQVIVWLLEILSDNADYYLN